MLAACVTGDLSQQWRSLANGSIVNAASGLCLARGDAHGAALLQPCQSDNEHQVWSIDDGFFTLGRAPVPPLEQRHGALQQQNHSHQSKGAQVCLQVNVGTPFCNATVCPAAFARNFTSGMPLATEDCHNGDRSMLFALQAVVAQQQQQQQQQQVLPTQPRAEQGGSAENLVPLTWATSAYVGNGALGLRVASEPGEGGVLRLFLDNVMLGAGGHRQPMGYFRLHVNAKAAAGGAAAALRVSLRQRLGDARLTGEVVDAASGEALLTLDAFVQADYNTQLAGSGALAGQGAAVVQLRWATGALASLPQLEWVQAADAQPRFAWTNTTTTAATTATTAAASAPMHELTAFASVVTTNATAADSVVAAAAAAGRTAELARHRAWWAAYWEQAFVTLPSTRVEALYYVEMYRFAASDRVTLHGLMGAFGPDGIFNLWGDYVWDMNEQVMYWLAAASNRPQISEPMAEYVETHGAAPGGLWMVHNYVKQARFDGREDRLRQHAWGTVVGAVKAQAGGSRAAPGSLKLLAADGRYHIVGCSSPEYRCYPPFEALACTPSEDCNYALAQLRWGIQTALALTTQFGLEANLTAAGVDAAWWRALLGDTPGAPPEAGVGSGELAWYPHDNATGFRLDAKCSFDCPHRHFSHLLQMYDLETVRYDASPATGDGTVNALIHRSLDRWYAVTCDAANWFNEECRGFTHCGFAAMSAVSARPAAAAGNLTQLLDTLVTPNGMCVERAQPHVAALRCCETPDASALNCVLF